MRIMTCNPSQFGSRILRASLQTKWRIATHYRVNLVKVSHEKVFNQENDDTWWDSGFSHCCQHDEHIWTPNKCDVQCRYVLKWNRNDIPWHTPKQKSKHNREPENSWKWPVCLNAGSFLHAEHARASNHLESKQPNSVKSVVTVYISAKESKYKYIIAKNSETRVGNVRNLVLKHISLRGLKMFHNVVCVVCMLFFPCFLDRCCRNFPFLGAQKSSSRNALVLGSTLWNSSIPGHRNIDRLLHAVAIAAEERPGNWDCHSCSLGGSAHH